MNHFIAPGLHRLMIYNTSLLDQCYMVWKTDVAGAECKELVSMAKIKAGNREVVYILPDHCYRCMTSHQAVQVNVIN